ncbi:putative lipid II flippase FtsW [Acetobacterium paludosum]|uniref:Probable peptidoglycan glycosyltransferase FtsW n=1 Tax=Acetobacterium paludosum TaxID=52693 RepID=A0A923HTE9_9FIRM|nr:putative lipid II flippase FtsW [Acetobacterium paludosum]MBC3886945.1 putative lipid II flippase FtsW [Acetobacterium paludosum]
MKTGKIDRPFLIALMIIAGIGVIMVFSASMYSSTISGEKGYTLFLKQLLFDVLGVIVMIIMSKIDYRTYKRYYIMVMVIAAFLLLIVLIPGIGVKVNDARRWLDLKFTTFQPSEFAKVAGIIYYSTLIARKPNVIREPGPFFRYCMMPLGFICAITVIEPSLSATMAIVVGMGGVLYFSGVRFKILLPYIGFGLLAFIGLMIAEPWRLDRFNVFLGKSGYDYQITQSLLAIGTGGIFGKGLGNGKQKYSFLPELQNDFIFSNIAEEFGFIGCVVVLGLFAFVIWRGFQIAQKSPDTFGYLYTSSVMLLLAFQVLVNIGVASAIIPVTGMALPFMSAGGSSVIILFAMMGPILNISRGVDLSKKRL